MTLKKLHKKCGCFADKVKGRCNKLRQCEANVEPLSQKGNTGRFRVCKVTGDRKHCAKMASLGLYPGEEMELICKKNGSNCIIKVHGGNITLDNDTTKNILVTHF